MPHSRWVSELSFGEGYIGKAHGFAITSIRPFDTHARGMTPKDVAEIVRTPQISGDDPDEYKRTLKGQLKRVLEAEKEVVGGAPEFVIAFIQAAGSEPTSNFLKSSRKVHCMMQNCS